MRTQAYFENWSRRPGDTVRMAVSSTLPRVHASFERLIGGPGDPATTAKVPVEELPDVLARDIAVVQQQTSVGSYADFDVRPPERCPQATIHLWFWSTMPGADRDQVLLRVGNSDRNLRLTLRSGELHVEDCRQRLPVASSISARQWYSVVLQFDEPAGTARVDVQQVTGFYANTGRWITSAVLQPPRQLALRLATAEVDANGSPMEPYDGKLENPRIYGGLLTSEQCDALHFDQFMNVAPLAEWDFASDQSSRIITSLVGGQPAGLLRNGGDRGVTGHNWSGRSDSFVERPNEYRAVHFHEDDLVDAGWDYSLEFQLPRNLASGIYCVKLAAGSHVDRYPLFVRSAGNASNEVLFLVPTNTYLAYANDRLAALDLSQIMDHEVQMTDDEVYLHTHPALGRSTYDIHSDGSPVRYSSRRRPLVNVRPGYASWLTGSYRHFAADLYLLEWLERSEHSFDVATDEDVETDGVELFGRYKTVVTGSHPEYWTWRGRDALETYLTRGGRLMYLGGNGFYWVTTLDPERPWIVEVRRDATGTRCWDAPPGERTHTSSGEPGGIWRQRGRGPNSLVGVGFSSEGFATGRPYRRTVASQSDAFAGWFDGVEGPLVGECGYILGAAAADEIDRFDEQLGSPRDTYVLATATDFPPQFGLVVEDKVYAATTRQAEADLIRADITYLPLADGGAVFSAGSIAFCGALAWNDFDNPLALLTTRVLHDFCGELPNV